MLRPQEGLRLVLAVAGLVMLVVAIAYAAPIGALKQFRVPTRNGNPLDITQGSDGNFWFTESHVNPPQTDNHHVGRITPSGDITEFLVCQFCFPNRIVQGPNGVLYFTKSDPALGRITTDGQVMSDVVVPNSLANGNGIAAHGNDIFFAAFNTRSIWRYSADSGQFTEFLMPTPDASPSDVAVDANGIVWFTDAFTNQIGKLNPATRTITLTPIPDGDVNGPRGIAIATDGKVWFTKRFSHVVGFFDPSTNQVQEFQLATTGPEGIAAAPDGSVWFTQSVAGNIARITASGVITEGKSVKGSEPFGITIAPNGDPWYAELSADKIATLQLR
jgi:streptogramin lyase